MIVTNVHRISVTLRSKPGRQKLKYIWHTNLYRTYILVLSRINKPQLLTVFCSFQGQCFKQITLSTSYLKAQLTAPNYSSAQEVLSGS